MNWYDVKYLREILVFLTLIPNPLWNGFMWSWLTKAISNPKRSEWDGRIWHALGLFQRCTGVVLMFVVSKGDWLWTSGLFFYLFISYSPIMNIIRGMPILYMGTHALTDIILRYIFKIKNKIYKLQVNILIKNNHK